MNVGCQGEVTQSIKMEDLEDGPGEQREASDAEELEDSDDDSELPDELFDGGSSREASPAGQIIAALDPEEERKLVILNLKVSREDEDLFGGDWEVAAIARRLPRADLSVTRARLDATRDALRSLPDYNDDEVLDFVLHTLSVGQDEKHFRDFLAGTRGARAHAAFLAAEDSIPACGCSF